MKLKTTFILTIALLLFSNAPLHAQAQRDTTKTTPKYEYAFLFLRSHNVGNSLYYPEIVTEMIIDFNDGQQEDFGRNNSLNLNSQLNTNSDALFKAFRYLSSMRYELVTSLGNFSTGMQYTFRRER